MAREAYDRFAYPNGMSGDDMKWREQEPNENQWHSVISNLDINVYNAIDAHGV